MTTAVMYERSPASPQFTPALRAAVALVPAAQEWLKQGNQSKVLESLRAAEKTYTKDVTKLKGLILTTCESKAEAIRKNEPTDRYDAEIEELKLELADAIANLSPDVAIIGHAIFALSLLEI